MLSEGKVGPRALGDGAQAELRLLRSGAVGTADIHARYYESAYRGALYSVGMTSTALSANTIALSATATPIIGVWNPPSSMVNLVLLKAKCLVANTAVSAVQPGAFMWATSIGNTAISTGLNPLNRKTLMQAGSQAKGFNISTPLTGLTNALVLQHAAGFGTLVAPQGATPTPFLSGDGVEEFDGAFIVPPGGVVALLNTASTITVNVASMLLWEEVPL